MYQDGEYKRCADACLCIIKNSDDDYSKSYAYTYLGNCHYQLGDLESAISDYTKAINICPEEDQIRSGLGCVYEDLGNYRKAINYHIKEVRLFPNNISGWHNLANFLVRRRKWTMAKKIYDMILHANIFDYSLSAGEYSECLYRVGSLAEELKYLEHLKNRGFTEKWIEEDYHRVKEDISKEEQE